MLLKGWKFLSSFILLKELGKLTEGKIIHYCFPPHREYHYIQMLFGIYIYIYIYIYVHTYMYTYVCIHTYIYIYMHMHVYMHVFAYIYIPNGQSLHCIIYACTHVC